MRTINLLPRLTTPSPNLALPLLFFLLIHLVNSDSPCTPINVTFQNASPEIPTPSITFVTSKPCPGNVKVKLDGEWVTSDLNAFSLREEEELYDHITLLQLSNSQQPNPTMNQQCSGIGENEIECKGQVVARQGYLKNVHPQNFKSGQKVKKADGGVIVVYVILIVAVLALLFFIINWLRCMRRRQRYVDSDEMEEVPDNTI